LHISPFALLLFFSFTHIFIPIFYFLLKYFYSIFILKVFFFLYSTMKCTN
jgi:hypothetical protein